MFILFINSPSKHDKLHIETLCPRCFTCETSCTKSFNM